MRKLLLLLAVAACASSGVGPGAVPPPPPAVSGAVDSAESAAFDRFVDDYFKSYFTFHPSAGTQAGFHEYDNDLEDFSRASIERRIAELHAQEKLAAAFVAGKGAFD